MLPRVASTLCLVVAMALLAPATTTAQDGRNVLVVVNTGSPESPKIGAKYAGARGVPDDQIVQIKTAITDEIDRRQYDLEIELPIAEWISRRSFQDRIFYIVLTKGIPLRIRGSSGLTGTIASVDSELTLLYRKLLGSPVPPAGRVQNPYFHRDRSLSEAKAFSHEAHDIYLVTRLDAFTLEETFRLIDRGKDPVAEGQILLD